VIWLRRGEDDAAEKRCGNEFSIKNVSETHKALDAPAEAACHTLYKWAIGFGGYPNEVGVLAAMTRTETAKLITFEAALVTNNPILITVVLKTAVEAAIGALKVFRLIFPERFKIMGVDGEIDMLVGQLNAVFAAYAGKP
jgi:hypothetical protein